MWTTDAFGRDDSRDAEWWSPAPVAVAVAVMAHAHHGRLDLVAEWVEVLPARPAWILTHPATEPVGSIMDIPFCGPALLALAMVDLDRAERAGDRPATHTAVRMIALAQQFGHIRHFHPTLSSTHTRQTAERADPVAYRDAVSSYADLTSDELRAAALSVLRRRPDGNPQGIPSPRGGVESCHRHTITGW